MNNKRNLLKYGFGSIAAIAAGYVVMKARKKMTESSDYRRHFDLDNSKGSVENYSSKFITENIKLQQCFTFLVNLAKLGENKATQVELKNYSNSLLQSMKEATRELKEFCYLHNIDFTDSLSTEFEDKLKKYDNLNEAELNDLIFQDFKAINKGIRDILWKLNDESKSDLLKRFYQKLIRKNDNHMEHIVDHII